MGKYCITLLNRVHGQGIGYRNMASVRRRSPPADSIGLLCLGCLNNPGFKMLPQDKDKDKDTDNDAYIRSFSEMYEMK